METSDVLSIIQLAISERDARIAELEKQIKAMQQPGALTAQELYRISAEASFRRVEWVDLYTREKMLYEQVANFINGVYINPLAGLVRTAVESLTDQDLMIEDSPDGWYEKKVHLLVEAKRLLGKEIYGNNTPD